MQLKDQLYFNDFVRCSECHNEEFRTTTNPKTGKPQRVKWRDCCTLCCGDGFILKKGSERKTMSGIFNLEEFQQANAAQERQAIDVLRTALKEKAEKLQALEKMKSHHDGIVKSLAHEAHELREEIRKAWAPFVAGADSSELDFGTVKLIMYPELSVTMENEDEVISWLLSNGYKDVLKYHIHHATFKSIGRKLYSDPEKPMMIPGAKYNEFQKIKVM